MKNTLTAVIAIAAIVLIGGAFILTKGNPEKGNVDANPPAAKKENLGPSNNVTVVDGVQIIEIKARGGYIPRKSTAQAGLPTILRFNTNGTFDCSSAVIIPSFNIRQNLPISGQTDIELPASPLGTLKGSCSMGMYTFEVTFRE